MLKKIILIIFVLGTIMITVLIIYKLILPNYLAEIITSDTLPPYIPEKYKIQIESIQRPLNNYSKDALKLLDSSEVSEQLILKAIDSINPEDVMRVYYQLENKKIEDSEKVYELIEREIKIKDINISLYKTIFLTHATPERINRALRYAETHQLATSMAPSTAKKIAKQIVINHYETKKLSHEILLKN